MHHIPKGLESTYGACYGVVVFLSFYSRLCVHSGPEDGLVKLSYYSYWSSEGICVCASFLCVFFFFVFLFYLLGVFVA